MSWGEALLDLIYPRHCPVCDRIMDSEEKHICRDCLQDIPLTYYWSWANNPLEKKLWGRSYLQSVVSLFFYSRDNGYSHLIHRIKYGGDISLGKYLGSMLGNYLNERMKDGDMKIDYIIPVPLHPVKQFRRGFNQASVIAEGIASGLKYKTEIEKGVLRRHHHATSQTKMSVEDKWSNVADDFSLRPEHSHLEYKHILLVDDVLTSGATVEACCSVLSIIEGIKISVATLATVQY